MLGKVTKLFPLKFNFVSEDKKPRLPRFAPSDILQSLKSRFHKEHKFEEEGTVKQIEFELLFGHNHEADAGPLHPWKDNFSRFLMEKKEGGSTLTTIPSA